MEHEFILIAEKLKTRKCKSHHEIAVIELIDGNIEITSCCNGFKERIERKMEYEFYLLFNTEDPV